MYVHKNNSRKCKFCKMIDILSYFNVHGIVCVFTSLTIFIVRYLVRKTITQIDHLIVMSIILSVVYAINVPIKMFLGIFFGILFGMDIAYYKKGIK